MNRRSARGKGTATVGVVGAATSDGARIREALAAMGIAGERVDLYAPSTGEAIISEYAGEARLIQEPALDEIVNHDVVFLCEIGELAASVAEAANGKTLVVDLVGALPPHFDPVLVHMDINPQAAVAHRGYVQVPHPMAIVLGEMLHPLERTLGLDEAVAVVMRPAADFGERGVEELRDQTIGLLNFSEVPVATFGRQLAFNIIPQQRLACAAPGVESRIATQVVKLMGWTEPKLAIKLLATPVFYGHGLQLRLRFRNGATMGQVREVVDQSDALEFSQPDGPSTPLEVSEDFSTRLVDLSEDGTGGYWIWAVAGSTGAKGAAHALRVADALCDL